MPVVDARYYKTLLICPHRALAGEICPMLATALPLAPQHQINSWPNRRELVDLFKSFQPKLCVLDFVTDPEQAFSVLSDIAVLASEMPVIALLPGNSPDLILRCVRQGATEFLIRPVTPDQLEAALEKVARMYPAPTSGNGAGGKTIAVIPAKGGSGATTLACNLAHKLKKNKSDKVLLADLDALTGTVSFLLKLKSTYSFLDILARGAESVDVELWKQLVVPSHGIDVLLPPENLIEGLDDLPEATPVIETAQAIYQTTVFDCGTAFGRWNLSVATACDEILLVTTNEIASLQATQRLLAWYEQMKIAPSKIRLLVNRYHREIGLGSDGIGRALETEVFHVIPSDYDTLQKAIMDSKPAPANSTFGKSIAALAARLVEAEHSHPEQRKGVFAMFGR